MASITVQTEPRFQLLLSTDETRALRAALGNMTKLLYDGNFGSVEGSEFCIKGDDIYDLIDTFLEEKGVA